MRRLVSKPVVLFVDETHDPSQNPDRLKRLCEVVADGGGVLSIVLADHPKLRNALLRPNMEETGFRFAVFPFEGMAAHQAAYIAWLLECCLPESVDAAAIIEPRRSGAAYRTTADAIADRAIFDARLPGDVPSRREGGHRGCRGSRALASAGRSRAAALPATATT
jgi:hypothetical protein